MTSILNRWSRSIPRVLYIDKDISVKLNTILEKHGHEVDSISTGKEGLSLHSAAPYEIIIVNYQLEDKAGIDLCRELLRNDRGLPIVLITGQDSQKLVSEALDIGVSQYVTKDDRSDYLELLPDIIAILLRRAETTREMQVAIEPKKINEEREKELIETRELFDTLVQKAPIGIFYSGPDGIIRYVNKALVEATCYAAEELIGAFWYSKIHPEDRDIITEQWLAKVHSAQSWQAEFRFLKPDETVAWVIGNTNPQLDVEGKVIGHVGTITDITDHKQIEKHWLRGGGDLEPRVTEGTQELNDSEKRFRDYSEVGSDWYWELDKDLCYTAILPATAGEAEFPVSDYIGRPRAECRPEGIDEGVWQAHVDDLNAHRLFRNFIQPRPLKDGSVIWLSVSGKPLFDEAGTFFGYRGTANDITDAREIETRLHTSEERYRQVADVSSDWVWEMDAELRFSYFSEGFQRITGSDPVFSLGKTHAEIISANNLEKPHWREHLNDLEAQREFRDFQYAFVDRDGKRRYFQISGMPVFENDGSFRGYRGTASDVTMRVSTQEALDESTAKLRHAVAMAKLGHYVWDGVTKRVISCTEECARIHGVSIDEYVAVTNSLDALFNWIHPDDRDYYREATEKAVAARSDLELEYRIVSRDGQIRFVHEVFDPIYDKEGQLVQTVGALQDVTLRTEVEQALKGAERLASLGNWRWSVEKNQIISWSEGFARVLGIPMEEIPERMREPGFGGVYIEDRERLNQVFNEAMEKGLNYEIQYRTVRTDGEIRDIQEIGEAILDADGKCRELKGTIQDITDRKNVERELNEAKIEAELANQAKSAFLSSMSHELRTPLNAILGFSQVLESDRNDPLTTKQKQSIAYITDGGHHLLELITQVLDFARIETGKIRLSFEPINLDFAMSECLPFTEALVKKQKIKIINNLSGKDLPSVRADVTRFKQVLLNLLSNGVKYNRDGGTLTVDAVVTDEAMMRISITDTGFGIDKKLHGHVFQAFDRLGRESLEVEGTGIGLTISKQLVGLMQGRIGFESEINKGSTFWIELPLADENDLAKVVNRKFDEGVTMNQPAGTNNQLHRVLYIEDNPTNTQLMVRIFENLPNIELQTTIDAESGLKLAKSGKPDLILMDIQLPGMDGIEAFAKLKSSEKTRDIPVIAITAAAMKADIERAQDVGFYDYLTKPVDIGKTVGIVRKALDESV